MGNTSTAAKQRYKDKVYKKFQIDIKIPLFDRIEAFRELHGISRSQFLEQAIERLEQDTKK